MWESLADKPLIKCCPRADTFPMFMPTTVDVVNGKKFNVAVATASTTHRPPFSPMRTVIHFRVRALPCAMCDVVSSMPCEHFISMR